MYCDRFLNVINDLFFLTGVYVIKIKFILKKRCLKIWKLL